MDSWRSLSVGRNDDDDGWPAAAACAAARSVLSFSFVAMTFVRTRPLSAFPTSADDRHASRPAMVVRFIRFAATTLSTGGWLNPALGFDGLEYAEPSFPCQQLLCMGWIFFPYAHTLDLLWTFSVPIPARMRYHSPVVVRDDIMGQLTEFKDESPAVELRVRVCMAKRGIKSIAELNRQLQEEGVEISHQQLSRIVDNKAQHLSVALLAGLIKVLRCRIDELFSVNSTKTT